VSRQYVYCIFSSRRFSKRIDSRLTTDGRGLVGHVATVVESVAEVRQRNASSSARTATSLRRAANLHCITLQGGPKS